MVRSPRRAALGTIVALALVGAAAPAAVHAQDSCDTSTEDNIAHVEAYVAAVASGDAEAIEAALHADFSHNLSTDDVEFEMPEGTDTSAVQFEIIDIFGTADKVAVEYSFLVHPDDVPSSSAAEPSTSTALAIVTLDCGEITDAVIETDTLEILLSHGYTVEVPA